MTEVLPLHSNFNVAFLRADLYLQLFARFKYAESGEAK